MAKVTGIGGIFFTTKDVKKTRDWYKKTLGIESGEYGGQFEWRDKDHPEQKKTTIWSPFPDTTDYFNANQRYMVNYRVDDLDGMLKKFKAEKVKILGGPESFEYGKFAWIEDLDGNRIELWEPIDEPFLKD